MAAFSARLWRDVLGEDCPTGAYHGFTDIGDSVFEADIACLFNLGVAKGTTSTTFSPDAKLTTAQVTRFIARLLNKTKADTYNLASSDELAAAALCIKLLHIAPNTNEAKASTPTPRSQMAVYLVGAWHNASGRGMPPIPPVKPDAVPMVHLEVDNRRPTIGTDVGRIAPNKCCHDLISALRVLVRTRPEASLLLVGKAASDGYRQSIEALAERLGLSVRLVLTGRVSDDELLRWYRRADVFACASEHEGFCVPIVEAMATGVPVVAYNAAAVAETVQNAGIVLGVKHPATLAAAIDRILKDQPLRSALIERGRGAPVGWISASRVTRCVKRWPVS